MRKYLLALSVLVVALAIPGVASAAPLSGAVFTTDSTCSGVDLNIYNSKDAVYFDGGPAHPAAAGLPDGYYYIQVTEPNGTVLGTSVGSGNETPIHVVNGEPVACYQLSSILIKASNGDPGYDTTTNAGGEYKMWISTSSSFVNNDSKTDNFKVNAEDTGGGDEALLSVRKYYDADVDGVKDPTEIYLDGWRFNIKDGINWDRDTPVSMVLFAPDTYFVTEQKPAEKNWINTDPSNPAAFLNPLALPQKSVDLAVGDDQTLEFGNVCLGAGGGLTLGFWSNPNGKATMNDSGTLAPELALLTSKSLRTANGGNFDPTDYTAFRNWLLSATAVNMSYMLSAQYAAMLLNVEAGKVNPSALVWNGSAFVSISSVLADAETALATDGSTPSGDPNRASQEALKNTLDNANNNLNFVQANPCSYTFGPLS
jgi:hypothetical protein